MYIYIHVYVYICKITDTSENRRLSFSCVPECDGVVFILVFFILKMGIWFSFKQRARVHS